MTEGFPAGISDVEVGYDADGVAQGLDRLLAPLEAAAPGSDVTDVFRLACTELLTNAICYRSAPVSGPMLLRLAIDGPSATVTLRETGPPLPEDVVAGLTAGRPLEPDPYDLPERGWGLFLAAKVMDSLEVSRDGGCTRIALRRRLFVAPPNCGSQ